MFSQKGLFATYFVLSILVIVALSFQINDTYMRQRETRVKDQEDFVEANKLIIQSSTQQHPLFRYEFASKAKIYLDRIIYNNGGILNTEKNLGLAKGELDKIKAKIHGQHELLVENLMTKIIEVQPEFDQELNESAGLVRKRPKSRRTNH